MARIAPTGKLFSYQDKKINAAGNYADGSFLNMFSFPLIKGNKQTALQDAHSIVVTEKFAKKLFGNEDALNKIISIDNADNFTVTGILKDLPDNTRLQFEYLLPWKYLQAKGIENATWTNNYTSTFVELQPSANIDVLNKKLGNIIGKYDKNEQDVKVFLYPLTRLHLWDRFENGEPVGGNIDTVRMLCILAAIMLIIACINFINLSTARSEKRSKEVGVRKVMGAAKQSLVFQFIAESLILAFIAGVFALVIIQLVLPSFSVFANVHISLAYNSPVFWLSFLLFIVFTGIIAGSYPAFYLSSFKPVKVLKGAINTGKTLATPRKILVIIQFVFAIFLINFTIIFQKQINHTESREIGFVQNNLLFHPLTDDLKKNYDLVKYELLNSGAATAVSKSSTTVTRQAAVINGLSWQGADPKANSLFEYINTSGDFVKTNGLQLIAGRDIDMKTFPADSASCVINESASKLLHFKNPIGQIISETRTWKIVGVVKDFLIGSPDQEAGPMLIAGGNDANYININSAKASVQNIKAITSILKKYNPGYPTELGFAEEDYAAKFRHVKDVSILINSFAFIAIFISCLGLFGLSAYMAEKRTKEIGIRKVLGSNGAKHYGITNKKFPETCCNCFFNCNTAGLVVHELLPAAIFLQNKSLVVDTCYNMCCCLVDFILHH